MESSLNKSLIRKTVLHYRKLLPPNEYKKRNSSVLARLDDLLSKMVVESIHVFLPIVRNKEPDVSSLLPVLWERKIATITSITDFKNRSMRHYLLDAGSRLQPNRLGIPEPVNAVQTDLSKIGAILVPLLVGDKEGNRIGYGGGYYDKLLKETKASKIGLCLSNPVDQIEQTDDWDIPLDYLITPYKIYNYG